MGASAAGPTPRRGATERPRILVDDETGYCDLLAKTWRWPSDVDTAPDGRSALERLRLSLRLLIADLKMPGIDGLAVIRDAARADLPVIIITGYSTESAAIKQSTSASWVT
jgi:DNA-binding response OmpR family regulator